MGILAGNSRTGSFVERFALWSDDDLKAAKEIGRRVETEDIEVIRLAFADQHGMLRGKTLIADEPLKMLQAGCNMTTTLLAKDTAHRTVYPVFSEGGGFGMAEMTGGGDFVMVSDPSTFRVLPWAPKTGWVLCDIYFTNGEPVPFSTRRILRDAVGRMAGEGHDFIAGIEVEFHLLKLEDPKLAPHDAGQPGAAPEVSLLAHGYQYLTELRADELDPAVSILRRGLLELGLPLRSCEVEFGPSQIEFTFKPLPGLEAADLMTLFRSATKQIARRNGLHATFMCRPGIANLFSSGWHLHQSLIARDDGRNLFVPDDDGHVLSPLARHYTAGLLDHAREAALFTAPTINGYKRYQPYSLAPDRAVWARDNRGAMVRALGGVNDPATRIENRIGESAANPYLYMASQIICGLDGIKRKLELPPSADTPYETEAAALPKSLIEALDELKQSTFFREQLGDRFIDYLVTIKQAEIDRFLSTVTDWEQREYFALF